MASGKPAGAQKQQESAQAPPETPEVADVDVASAEAAELVALRQQLEEAQRQAAAAAELAQEADARALAEAARAERVLTERTELQQMLDAVEASAREAQPAPAVNDRLADVLEALGEQLAARGVEEATFRQGESAASIAASLEGKVSIGEHSGELTPGGVPVVFLSRGAKLRILKKARIRYTDARGELVVTEGIHYPFEPDGRFETDDQVVVDYLRARPAFNVEFWEMGQDPNQAPDPQPVLDTIMDAMIELDDERLAVIEAEELGGLKREVVLKSVQTARRKVQGLAETDLVAGDHEDAEMPA